MKNDGVRSDGVKKEGGRVENDVFVRVLLLNVNKSMSSHRFCK